MMSRQGWRNVLRLGGALAIGTAINLAVAWWLFFVSTPPRMTQVFGTPSGWLISVPPTWPAPERDGSGRGKKLGLTFEYDHAQVLYPRDVPGPPRTRCEYIASRFAAGLPMRSFAAHWWVEDDTELGKRSRLIAVPSPQHRATPTIRDGMLPIVPVWPGFAVNTLLFASPLLLWWCVLPWARARRYRKAGGCPRCGFDRRTLPPDQPCPECGSLQLP
jgi:hypothetical protein